ncbi:ATPase [Metallosphaera tengchongensis]|uniref:ATPase n=1 Tax=Metallosphaera tengchongensis TaxID=1532350 RepID=A0A6N0NWU7_9CREN|nr:ATPase [Metallosphaera tengchongensis]QKQ99599.1 ATPase [Metallosphaera tengchongensis]
MKVLINGGLPYDSGKTRFGLTLLSRLIEVGVNVVPMKPVAGHNAWYSFSTLLRSLDLNVLVGNDALSYYDVTKREISLINPFSALLFPINLDLLEWNFPLYSSMMERGYPVLFRLRTQDSTAYFLGPVNLVPESLKEILGRLISTFKPVAISENEAWNLILDSGYLVDPLVQRVLNENEHVMIESYNNAASPSPSSSQVDVVVTVVPSKAYVFSGSEYKRFLELNSIPPWIIKAEAAFKYIKPKGFPLEPITSKNDEVLDYILKEMERR